VTADTVATGSRQWLIQFSDITSLLGAFPNTDPVVANRNLPFLFTGDLFIDIRTYPGTTAAVLTDSGGWTVPQPLNTWRFRRLRLDIYVDPLRDGAGNITESSSLTAQRGMNVFRAFQARLHRRDPDTILWGDMVTLQSQLLTEPQFFQMPQASGSGLSTQVGTAYYGIAFSGWTDVAS